MDSSRDIIPLVQDIKNVLESNPPEDRLQKEIETIFLRKFAKEFTGDNKDTLANLSDLPDTVLLKIFGNLSLPELCHIALVCKHWLWIVYDSELWKFVDLSKYKEITESHIVNLIQVRLSPLLKTLDLSNREITPVILNELTEHCQQLDTLVLRNCLLHEESNQSSNLSSIPDKLVRLDVRNFKQGFYFVHLILEAKDLSNLECFGFGSNDFCPAFTEFHTIFRKMHALRILECIQCPTINDNQIHLISEEIKCLESLVLRKCNNITGTSIPYLIENSINLRSLNLSETNIESRWLIQAAWEKSIIEELDFSFCMHINAEALINVIPRIHTLQHLALHNVGKSKSVTLPMFEKVFEQKSWVNLEVLCLRFCNRVSGDALSYLENCSNLKYLSLRSCFKMSYLSISEILKHLPNLLHLECGSLLLSEESICNDWIKIMDNCSLHCKQLMKIVLVKCSSMGLSKLAKYRKVFENFFACCLHLNTVRVLYSEESILRILKEALPSNRQISISDDPSLEIIPSFRHSLDTELNRKRFRTFSI